MHGAGWTQQLTHHTSIWAGECSHSEAPEEGPGSTAGISDRPEIPLKTLFRMALANVWQQSQGWQAGFQAGGSENEAPSCF